MHLIARSKPTTPSRARSATRWSRWRGLQPRDCGRAGHSMRVVDRRGFRPLVMGRLGEALWSRSETCALDLVGAAIVRELEPGDFVRIEEGGYRAAALRPAAQPLRVRAGLLRAARQHRLRRLGGWGAPRARPAARREQPGGGDVVFACPTAPTRWPLASPRCRASSWSTASSATTTSAAPSSTRRQDLRVAKVKIKFNPVRDVIDGRSRDGGRQPGPRYTPARAWCG